jgi:hypothetical protein
MTMTSKVWLGDYTYSRHAYTVAAVFEAMSFDAYGYNKNK